MLASGESQTMRNQALLAGAILSMILLIGVAHAPPAPVLVGAGLACAWLMWRPKG